MADPDNTDDWSVVPFSDQSVMREYSQLKATDADPAPSSSSQRKSLDETTAKSSVKAVAKTGYDARTIPIAADSADAASSPSSSSPRKNLNVNEATPALASVEEEEAVAKFAPTIPTVKHKEVESVPKWRFSSNAKKSLGYSSAAAGKVVAGKTADELAAKYVAPKDSLSVVSEKEERVIGKLCIDEGGDEVSKSHQVNGKITVPHDYADDDDQSLMTFDQTMFIGNVNSVQPDSPEIAKLKSSTEALRQQQANQQIKIETLEIKQEQEHIRKEIQAAEIRKSELIKETETILQRKSQAGEIDVVGAAEMANGEEKKKRPWCMYFIILILLGAIVALLGIMLSSNDDEGETEPNKNQVIEGASPTRAPALRATSSPNAPDGGEEVIIPPGGGGYVGSLTCPEGTKKFELSVQLSMDPSEVTWKIIDRCTLNVFYRCVRCYTDSSPDVPIAFAACLPIYNIVEMAKQPIEFVFQMVDLSGGTSFAYKFVYDGDLVVSVDEGTVMDISLQNYHFGDGGGCSEMPSEAPLPTVSPSEASITPYPTIQIAIEEKSGCTPFIETTNTCGREADVEFKLLVPRGVGAMDNQLLGSSVTFVGDRGTIVAVGSGVLGAPVNIYHKPEDPYLDDYYQWEHLNAIGIAEQGLENLFFGASIASNDAGYIVVGAPSARGGSGEVYVYRPNVGYTAWEMVARMTPTEGALAPSFGSSVAFDGSLIAIGSPEENGGKGAVYVYENTDLALGNKWVLETKVMQEDVAVGAQFGSSVSLFGDVPATLAIGAPKDSNGGSVFVYKRQDFQWLYQKLQPRDYSEGDEFGSSVVISGCTVAVTSPTDGTSSTTGTGSVRIFSLIDGTGDWFQSQILEPSDDLSGEIFGECIAMEGNTLLVGSPTGGPNGEQSGMIYHFERIGPIWSKISNIPNKDHVSGQVSDFGCPLSLSDDLFVVGSRGDSTLGTLSGSAVIFDLCPNLEDI